MRTRAAVLAGLMAAAVLVGCSNSAIGKDAATATEASTTTQQATTTPASTGTTPVPPVATTTAAAVLAVPRLRAQQAEDLYRGLLRIEPGFAVKMREILIQRARNECSSILGGSTDEKLVDEAIASFTTPTIHAVTRQQGAMIVDLIRNGGWCKN